MNISSAYQKVIIRTQVIVINERGIILGLPLLRWRWIRQFGFIRIIDPSAIMHILFPVVTLTAAVQSKNNNDYIMQKDYLGCLCETSAALVCIETVYTLRNEQEGLRRENKPDTIS